MKREIIHWIVLSVITTVLIMMIFHKSGKTDQMVRNEVELEYSERARLKDSAAFIERIAFYDSSLKASDQRYTELENKKQPIYNAIKNIRASVPDYTKEQLRAASAEYYKQYGQ